MVTVYVASAFSKNGVGGNKAGVVLNQPELTVVEKMAIAKDLGYSETAFVCHSSVADFSLEYFTPTEEVPLCGHATIAAFVVLRELMCLDKETYTIETKAGILCICLENDRIFMEQNRPTYGEILKFEELVGSMRVWAVEQNLPVQIVSTGLRDILLPVCSKEQLAMLSPDFEQMAALSAEKQVVGVHAFALVDDGEITAVCRNFAPLYGIDEESATGTSNCALACYLFKYHEKKNPYIFEQGHNLGAISRIAVNLLHRQGEIEQVWVGGSGYLVEKRQLPYGE